MTGPLVIIPCGGRKRSGTHAARDLYAGSFFRGNLAAALRLTDPSRIRILSGKHGLISLDTRVASYEQRLGRRGCVTLERVQEQAREQGIADERRVIVLGGAVYRAYAMNVWPHAITPTADARSMGDHLRKLGVLGR